jgi:PAS domain S-box-containing protein
MEKHHSCLNTRAVIEYFLETRPGEIPALLEDLGPEIQALPNPQEFLMEIHNWVSSRVVIRMFENARKITRNERIAFDIGFQSAARKKLGYVQRIILFAYKSPRRSLRRVQAINDKFNRNKRIEVVEVRRNRAIVRLHWFREIPHHYDFCLFNQGIYTGLPVIWNLPPARLEETRCFSRGDDYCEYHLFWERKSLWRETVFRFLAPWPILKSTIEELENDKELLKKKYGEVHRLNLQLRGKIDHLSCLQETCAAALSVLNLEELLGEALKLLKDFAHLDRSAVFLLDDGQEVYELIHAAEFPPAEMEQLRGLRAPVEETDNLISWVGRNGAPLAVDRFRGWERPLDFLSPAPGAILAPLRARHRIIGVMLASRHDSLHPITEAEQEFVVSFANHLAIALENASLYRDLELSERKYRGLVENAHEGVWITDEQGIIRFANRRMREILDHPRLEGNRVYRFCDPENRKLLERGLAQNLLGQVSQEELELTSPNRGPVTVLMSSVPLMEQGGFRGAFAMFSDITDKKRLERQLLQQQKMEAAGAMAAGMAHNFNNILMNIMGLTGLVLAGIEESDPAYGDLKQIEQEVLKGSALAKQFLSFGRGDKSEPRPLNLNPLLEKSGRLFSRTRGGIRLELDLDPRSPLVEADPLQMEQALLNLLVNAWQAMEGEGQITLTTRPVVLEDDFCRPYERRPGPYVEIRVADSGPGMGEAEAARIFEPFFTTKEVGQGTGLGLATVHAIVREHRGIVRVETQPGRGATFHIYLPVTHKPAVPERPALNYFRGVGTILLVDDEEGVRRVGQRILEQLGYQVLAAENGPRALSLLEAHRGQVDLVILDLLLPGMGGAEIYAHMKEMVPEIKVLVASGCSLDGAAQKVLDAGAQGFIEKPYRIDALSQKIAEILGIGARSSAQGVERRPGKQLRH